MVPGGNQTLYISVTNYGGSTSLWVNLGANKTFATLATSAQADYASTDLGGFERVIIAPTVLHDSTKEAQESVYKINRRLPTSEELAGLDYPRVPVYDGGRLVATLDPATHGPYLLKHHPEVMRAYTAALDAAWGRSDGSGPLGDAAYCSNCPLYVTVYGRTSSYVSVQYTTGAVTEALKDDVQVFRSAPGLPGASYFRCVAGIIAVKCICSRVLLYSHSAGSVLYNSSPNNPTETVTVS